MLFQLTTPTRGRFAGYVSTLGVLVVTGLLASCGESNHPEAGDEGPSSQRDGGEAMETDKPSAEANVAAPAVVAKPARPLPVGLPTSGRPAPALTLPDVESGQAWSLAAHADPTGESCPKGVLVAFMASWCTYCTQSLPTLVELEKANPELEIVTVTVDTTEAARKDELAKVRKAGLTGPVLAADDAAIQAWIGSGKSVPKYYFVNHNGVVTGKDDGFGEKVGPMMPKQAARALAD